MYPKNENWDSGPVAKKYRKSVLTHALFIVSEVLRKCSFLNIKALHRHYFDDMFIIYTLHSKKDFSSNEYFKSICWIVK